MSGEIVYFGEESQDETRNGNDKNKENEQTNFFQNGVDRGGGDSSGGLPLHGGNPGGVRHQHPAEPRHRRALLPAPGKLHHSDILEVDHNILCRRSLTGCTAS